MPPKVCPLDLKAVLKESGLQIRYNWNVQQTYLFSLGSGMLYFRKSPSLHISTRKEDLLLIIKKDKTI